MPRLQEAVPVLVEMQSLLGRLKELKKCSAGHEQEIGEQQARLQQLQERLREINIEHKPPKD